MTPVRSERFRVLILGASVALVAYNETFHAELSGK
jgi:hypothetical protein